MLYSKDGERVNNGAALAVDAIGAADAAGLNLAGARVVLDSRGMRGSTPTPNFSSSYLFFALAT
jgi:hypothetical protein